ncbi:hypothetical protein BU14_0562s0011 [Porphyra umbilicalis]|uniref:Transmembrane protein n=1 Tax=Porphyra umbilicalis TaxID=2786 RepID=A0A1X6NRP5_PORUM|nr:hypothetical protein BU14_0562s0011 [Porphyra umbilicalis]|eukprot:OSX71299.1 hypothetical protein BU14_0562s0011 [Porphyra umbilicalis]
MVSWWQLSQGLSTSLATRLRRRRLEGFKFSVYVLLPIGASYFFGSGAYPYLERIIQQRSYVVYPPEGPAPPKPNEMSRLVERERELYEARRGASGVSDAVQRPPFDARPQP